MPTFLDSLIRACDHARAHRVPGAQFLVGPSSKSYHDVARSLPPSLTVSKKLVVESTKLKAVEDVPLLPLAGPLFEGMEFPTGEVAKKVREPWLCHAKMAPSGCVVYAIHLPAQGWGRVRE